MVLYTFNSLLLTHLMVPELYIFFHLQFFMFCLVRMLTLKSYKIRFFCYLLIQKNASVWALENVKRPCYLKGYENNRNIKVMTSEILQLFTQALEMLISWSSFDCVLDSRMCKFIQRTFMRKPTKAILYSVLLKLSTQRARNGSVQFTATLHLKRLLLSAVGGTESFGGEMHTTVLFPWSPERCCSGRGGGVVLHKRDGGQLLTELLQHDHALQQGDVVDPGQGQAGNTSSVQGAGRLSRAGGIFRSKIKCKTLTYIGPSGSKPSNRFRTNRSLGVKSWMRWILTIRSPTTCTPEAEGAQSQARSHFQDETNKQTPFPSITRRMSPFTIYLTVFDKELVSIP